MKKVTWNDLHDATPNELKNKYKINDRQLENHVRSHLDGANAKERTDLYKKLWNKRK